MGVLEGIKGSFWPSGKRGLGSPLYLEEDGPILGVIDDIFLDKKSGQPVAYRVLASGQYLEVPAEAVTETPGGYTYRSPWFAEADALVRKLESQELLMPELLFSSVATGDADRKLLEHAIERSPALKKMVSQAQELYLGLTPRIEALDKEKYKVVGEVTELAEGLMTGRLPKDVHRERFVALKRRLQVLDASLHRAESLRRRLEAIPFVALAKKPEVARALSSSPAGADGGAHPAFRAVSTAAQGVPRAPPGSGEEWKRIRKFRVLKAETTLRQREESLHRMEDELQKNGGLSSDMVQTLTQNYDKLAQAIAKGGPDGLKKELERLIAQRQQETPKTEAKALGAALQAPSASTLGARTPGKTCPLCAEPLTGRETTCPGCQADLQTLESAKDGTTGPNGAEKFFRGGGATKLGVVLLLLSGATFLSWFLLR